MAVLALSDAKAYLGITSGDFDTQLGAIVAGAEAAIVEKCGPLEPTERTVRVAGGGTSTLLLPAPAGSIAAMADGDGNPIDVSTLHLDQEAGLLAANDGSWFAARWYDITYDHGRTTCPPDLLLAVKELVRHLWESQRGGTRRPGSTVSDATSNTIPGAAYMMPFRVSELIAPHLQWSVA